MVAVNFVRRIGVYALGITFTLVVVLLAPAHAQIDGPTGQSQQALVGGSIVSPETQEAFTLLTLSTGCSASLLRNNWVITAAHCVEDPDPRPGHKGEMVLVPEDSVTVSAKWRTEQKRKSMRIITFHPLDIAIIRVSMPFTHNGSTTNFNRGIFRDGQFPYFGTPVGVPITVFGRGIYQLARKTPGGDMPAQSDDQYRVGHLKTYKQDNDSEMQYWYKAIVGQSIGGGDSGGPSFAEVLNEGPVLVGVHSTCEIACLLGHKCGKWKGPGEAPPDYDEWDWVAGTPECADAPIAPVWDDINRYLGAFVGPTEPALEPPAPGFIGTFSTSPPNYQPIWVYGIKPDGDLLWYRKDTGSSPWQGPKSVGAGWAGFKDVIPAGGNSVYALSDDGKLWWYQHNGFNDGARSWQPQRQVGNGWSFRKIFSGGEGIIYAIKDDGTLLWYRHGGYADGNANPSAWSGPNAVGSGWQDFKDVFSMGEGKVYAVKQDGTLLFYQHINWQTGARSWSQPRVVGSGWQNFRQIVSVGDGVILAVTREGKLLWYKHYGRQPNGRGPAAQFVEVWDGPVEIGSGWHGFKRIFSLMPVATPQGPR